MLQQKTYSRGAEISHKTLSAIPADQQIRPLRDWMVVEPVERNFSAIIEVVTETKPVKGIVRAVGPGTYLIEYQDSLTGLWSVSVPKGQRKAMRPSKIFRPCDAKVGDLVGFEPRAFQTSHWGEKLCFLMREEDITGILEEPHGAAA